MKKILLSCLSLALSTPLLAQEVGINILNPELAVVQGGTGSIRFTLCNNDITFLSLDANRVRPLISLPATRAQITSVTNLDGSPLTAFTTETQTAPNAIRLRNAAALAPLTCIEASINFLALQELGTGTVTATLSFVGNNQTVNNISSNDNSTTTITVTGATPVSLTEFIAKATGKNADLTWKTAQEQNNAFFEVQHSTNGRSFETVGKVEGKGTTTQSQSYAFTHFELNPSVIHYYRLKQVDFDGKFEYSSIRSVQLEGYQGISLFASTQDNRNVKAIVNYGDDQLAKTAKVSLVDLSGRTLSTQQMELENGQNPVEFQTSALSSGLYLIRLENEAKTQAVKVALP